MDIQIKDDLIKERLENIFSKKEIESIELSNISTEKDILSSIFEKFSKNKKKYAQFYTHQELVNFILDNIEIDENSRILDPACGAGAFLLGVLKRNNQNIKNVYGIDIDPLALKICKINIEINNKLDIKNLINKNSLKDINLKKDFDNKHFDIILGNPPFKNLKRDNKDYSLNDYIFKKVLNGVANSASLMMVKSFELLKDGGVLAFVLPKNIIRVSSFHKLRNFIINNFKIKIILDLNHHFKDVRGDQIIMILQKEKIKEKRLNNDVLIIPYERDRVFNKANSYKFKQKEFIKYSFFPIFSNKDIISLSNKFLQIKDKLIDYGEIFRGISIHPIHQSLSSEMCRDFTNICFRGKSIQRFGIKYPLYLNTSVLGNNELGKIGKLKSDKIVLQNIFSKEGGIFATLSLENEISIDTVTNIILYDKSLSKYFVGLLNSRLVNFFMIFVIYLNSNFTMHTDKAYIGKIPIIIPDQRTLNEIDELVDKLLSIKDKYSDSFFYFYNKLNQYLYKTYNLNDDEINNIENSLKDVMSKKHWKKG
ncbi:MAG: N-6 DNA methylase [Candidatus Firestonebacteria bacterium]